MRRPQFSLRTLLLAITLLGLICGVPATWPFVVGIVISVSLLAIELLVCCLLAELGGFVLRKLRRRKSG